MILFTTLVILALAPVLGYVFMVWNYDYWRKRGVNGPKPKILIGTIPSFINQKQHGAEDMGDIYNKYKKTENYVGFYFMRVPRLLVLSPEIAHQIFVTSFKHFHDNEISKFIDSNKDPLIASDPFVMTGAEWKQHRAFISPGMTGTRIKVAYSGMQDVAEDMCQYIESEMKLAPKDGISGRDLGLRFTAETVCDCVLGIKAKSFTKNPIPIVDNVREFSEKNAAFTILFMLSGIFPWILNFYKVKFLPKPIEDFFLSLMRRALTIRSASKSDRLDFMNHLYTLKQKKNLSKMVLASHTMTFLLDGLDTTSLAIAHCLLLLAKNPAAQEKLHQEIIENMDEKRELSFEQITELPYLDACLHESLRMYSPALSSQKICTESFELRNKNGDKYLLKKGQQVTIPIHCYHHDPDHYEDPEEFKPERFIGGDASVKKYREKGVFLAFADGPRICLGMRFALVQSKTAIATIIRDFYVKPNPRTKKGNRLDPKSFLALHHGGVWLDFEKRAKIDV